MRSPTASVYLLVFVNSAILTALFPLVPAFEDEFSLSKLQIGVLFAAGGLAFLLVAIPIGILADRVGARSITIVTAESVKATSARVWETDLDGDIGSQPPSSAAVAW